MRSCPLAQRGPKSVRAGIHVFGGALLVVWSMMPGTVFGQRVELTSETYIEPPEVIRSAVLAPWHENISLERIHPDGKRFLLDISDGMPSVETMGQPHQTLAELKIDTESRRQSGLNQRSTAGLKVYDSESGTAVEIKPPAGTRVSNPSWSPDGSQVAFYGHSPEATHLYVADAKTGEAKRLTATPVLAVHVTSFEWTQDGSKIVTVLVPESDQTLTAAAAATHEPKVRLSREGKTPSRTYRYLLDTPADMRALERLSTGQLATVSVPGGQVTKIGEPAMIRSISVDPNAESFRVSYFKTPFSYYVPVSQFGYREVLVGLDGKELAELSDRDLRDGTSPQPAQTPGAQDPNAENADQKRNIQWRPDGSGISFLQLAPEKKAEGKPADAAADDKPADDKPADAAGKADKPADAVPPADKPADGDKPADAAAFKTADDAKQDPPAAAANPTQDPADPAAAGQPGARGARGGRTGRGGRGGQDRTADGDPQSPGERPENAGNQAPRRNDRVMLWKAPYGENDVETVFESKEPIRSIAWSNDGRWLFVTRGVGGGNAAGAGRGGRTGGPTGQTPQPTQRTQQQPTTAPQQRTGQQPQSGQQAGGGQQNQQTIHAVDLKNGNKEYLVFTGSGGGGAAGGRGRGGLRQSIDDSQIVDLLDFDTLDPWYATIENEWKPVDEQDPQDVKTDDPAAPATGQVQDPLPGAGNDKTDPPADDSKPADTKPAPVVGAKLGSLMTATRADGESVVRVSSDGHIYFSGDLRADNPADETPNNDPGEQEPAAEGPPKPPRTFIDRVNIETGAVQRVFATSESEYETVVTVDGDEVNQVYTVRQNRNIVPDYFVHDTSNKENLAAVETEKPEENKADENRAEGDKPAEVAAKPEAKPEATPATTPVVEPRRLTNNRNFTPWYNDLKVEFIQVTRVDGFKFWVKVTSNPDYGQKLPAMFWFYPREYTDQATYDRGADQTRRSFAESLRFQRPSNRSMAMLTQVGYVVIEPDLPIVGEAGRMNDNYVTDLRNGLWAVIDELDKRNIIDRDRLAIGGHSYGAFSTGNALAHTPFFKAGIAGDGCYSRTLTPMSFQSERRYYWDARETYDSMSPLNYANQVNGAMLMYHGMEDANVGTFPINSERMFQALDGLGKSASLYMYPYEAHGPAARETILDMWARWIVWLDTHVKNPEKPKAASAPAAPAANPPGNP